MANEETVARLVYQIERLKEQAASKDKVVVRCLECLAAFIYGMPARQYQDAYDGECYRSARDILRSQKPGNKGARR